MAEHLQHLMIRASAGSGKTWQLSRRFLGLLMLGVDPARIVALTFTRKAAGEFADRILSRLAEAAAEDESAAELAKELSGVIEGGPSQPGLLPGGTAGLTMNRALFLAKLEEVVRASQRLNLGTLDSFFARIVRCFGPELGLPEFELLEESQLAAQRLRVMARLFSEQGGNAKGREALFQAFKRSTIGEDENRLTPLFEDYVRTHQARFLATREGVRWGDAGLLWPERGGPRGRVIGEWSDLLATLEEALDSLEMNEKQDAKWSEWLFLLRSHKHGAPMPKELADLLGMKVFPAYHELRDGAAAFAVGGKKLEIDGLAAGALADLAEQLAFQEIAARVARSRGLFDLLEQFEDGYERAVRRTGRLGFADLTLFLAGDLALSQAAGGEGRLRVDYRLDGRFDHWLLDEFQDTSVPQWRAVESLVDEVVQDAGGERSLFVVGDTKQAIYGWRGGEPRLFEDLDDHYGVEVLKQGALNVSYRSSPVVLEFVNRVCDSSGAMAEVFPAAAMERWTYESHKAGGDAEKAAGFVGVWQLGSKSQDAEDRLEWLRERVEELAGGIACGLSCAVLVPRNQTARDLAIYLREEFPDLPVQLEGEVSVAADTAVGVALLDLFRWLRCPADGFAWGHVDLSKWRTVLAEWGEERWDIWRGVIEEISREGYGKLTGRLVRAIEEVLPLTEIGRERLAEVERAAWEFDERGGDLGEWVEFLQALTRRERSGAGSVQVMTVHKAKGLEFDAVILPHLGAQRFDAIGKVEMMEERDHEGRLTKCLLRPQKMFVEWDEELTKLSDAWAASECVERFCNLYVALTRAKRGLYLLIGPPPAPRSKKDIPLPRAQYEDWLRLAAGSDMLNRPAERELLFEQSGGKADWIGEFTEEPPPGPIRDLPILSPPPCRRERISPSTAKGSPTVSFEGGGGRTFGSEVHALFERLGWLAEEEEPALPDWAPAAAAKTVRGCLAVPEIRALFTEREGTTLHREQPFEVILEEKWMSGVVDRLHLQRGPDGAVTACELIDFKTDTVNSVDELTTRYKPQLAAYRRALGELFAVKPEEVRGLILSTHLLCLHEVEA